MTDMTATRDDLFRVFLAGMKTGAASALVNYAGAKDDDLIRECAEHLIVSIEDDPLAADALTDRAVKIASGIDPDDVEFRAYGGSRD